MLDVVAPSFIRSRAPFARPFSPFPTVIAFLRGAGNDNESTSWHEATFDASTHRLKR